MEKRNSIMKRKDDSVIEDPVFKVVEEADQSMFTATLFSLKKNAPRSKSKLDYCESIQPSSSKDSLITVDLADKKDIHKVKKRPNNILNENQYIGVVADVDHMLKILFTL